MTTTSEIVADNTGYGWLGREAFAKTLAGAYASPPIVLAGDSRAAMFPYNSVCGAPLINAGMPGIRVHDAVNFCGQAASNVMASPLTVLFIGINNAFLYPTDPEMENFPLDYAMLLNNLKSLGRGVVATTPWPLEKGFPTLGPDPSVITWSQYASAISAVIMKACYAANVPCIDLNGQMRLADLTLMPGMSQEGVHPNALGAATILKAIEPTVQYYLNH